MDIIIGCSSCIIIITVTLCYHASCMGGMHVIWPSRYAAHDVSITCSRIIMCNLIKITSRNVFSIVQRRAVFELDITESSHLITLFMTSTYCGTMDGNVYTVKTWV